ncbi:hypothetical protein VTJ49DRAFT_7467 [Mycothermus thermophilus]|uniref:DUF1763-domain-containing protein n=1 Tax=Humicola insolens TaxID=85995 RepID=A0ABR3VJD6_HUMIN
MATPKTPAKATTELIHAYRHLLRAALRAVQFSKPSRYTVVDRLREGFRDPKGTLDPERVRRTVWFFNAAAQSRGLEHKIMKTLCRVGWEQAHEKRRMGYRLRMRLEKDRVEMEARGKKGKEPDIIVDHRYEHYNRTIAMLNDSMGLCLR